MGISIGLCDREPERVERFALPYIRGNLQGRQVGRTLRVSRRGQNENRWQHP